MIQIKKLKKPTRRSGIRLDPGERSDQKAMGVLIVNIGKNTLYVDRVTARMRKKRK